MILMSPADAALAIGAKCGGSSPGDTDPEMIAILRHITTQVENLLGVETLTYGSFTDRVSLTDKIPHGGSLMQSTVKASIRLRNAFLDAEVPLVVTDPNGYAVTLETYVRTNNEKGMLFLSSWCRGDYLVNYSGGFHPAEEPDGQDAVLQGIPEWMKLIVVDCLVLWYRVARIALKPGAENFSYEQVMREIRREIAGAVYMRYDRPRLDVVFGQPSL